MESTLSKSAERNPEARPRRAPDRRTTLAPRVDVFENGQEFLVVAEVPGAAKDSIHVALEGGELTLSAKRAPRRTNGQGAQGEREFEAEYLRTFAVPDTIDADKVEAQFTGGLLHVKLPKRPEVKARKITVRAS
jgi:HSP20 family molecular chaperone IbpA